MSAFTSLLRYICSRMTSPTCFALSRWTDHFVSFFYFLSPLWSRGAHPIVGKKDMAWIEVTLATSSDHEALVDRVYNIFHKGCCTSECKPRASPWLPHLSLAYDNPDGTNFSPAKMLRLVSKFPSLLDITERRIMAISLWKTEGRMEEWKCLDRSKLTD